MNWGVQETDGIPVTSSRVLVVSVLGAIPLGLALVVALTFRVDWDWAPSWLHDSAHYGIAIVLMIAGLVVLAEVWHWARRLWRTIAGTALLVAGLAMLVLPGPGLVTIAAGLFFLSREYAWARRSHARVTAELQRAKAQARAQLARARTSVATGRDGLPRRTPGPARPLAAAPPVDEADATTAPGADQSREAHRCA